MIPPHQGMAVYGLGAPGAALCRRLAREMPGAEVFLPVRHARPEHGEHGFDSLYTVLAHNWRHFGGHVLACAAGMVIRCLAPLLLGKDRDPAVVVVDQHGRYAVSLLSGHLGGANDLARQVAKALGGQAVITTATDNLGLPSLEMEARELGLALENLPALAGVSGALVDGRQVPLCDPEGHLAPVSARWPGLFRVVEPDEARLLGGEPLVWVGWRRLEIPAPWLVLRPRRVVLGMGCNRGTSADELEGLALDALGQADAAPTALACLASARAKADEPGLLEAARRLGARPVFYEHRDLAHVEVPNPSDTVLRCLGTGSVCEAAAILAAEGGELILNKIKTGNATAAVAIK